MAESGKIVVIGATGYIGARLVSLLLQRGYRVRALARNLEKLKGCHWASHENVELVAADVLDVRALAVACRGCSSAYYLVHSMNSGQKDFESADRKAAQNMVAAAAAAQIERIIYLGGLGEEGDDLSRHLRSRAEVADILRHGRIPVTVLRAAMIIGSGSASFEILRYLVDRLPFMITPRWVRTPSQPIAVRNVLEYLIRCIEQPETIGQVFDIGGPTVITYQQLMDMYAQEAGLGKRLVIPIPYFTPRLSSYWIHLVTPVPAYIARPLAEGLKNPAVCKESRIRELIPQDLLDCRSAIKLAIACLQHQRVESHWTDAGAIPPVEWFYKQDPGWAGGTIYEDKRSMVVEGSADDLWQPIIRLGGDNGWYYGNWLWKLRGLIDRLLGGVGLDRGRRNASELKTGDALDLWRIAAIEPGRRLLLVAEMKLPGRAMLEFRVEPVGSEQVKLTQTARFLPFGLSGIIYWWLVSPLHNLVFGGMLRALVDARAVNRRVSSVDFAAVAKGVGD